MYNEIVEVIINLSFLFFLQMETIEFVNFNNTDGNYTQLDSSQAVPIIIRRNPPCPWTCELTNDAGYVVYSAFGSFYIPMFVMLFFYWRIYRAAVRTTRAINQGFRTTKGKVVWPPTHFYPIYIFPSIRSRCIILSLKTQ